MKEPKTFLNTQIFHIKVKDSQIKSNSCNESQICWGLRTRKPKQTIKPICVSRILVLI